MECQACGAAMRSDALFCGECGAASAAPSGSIGDDAPAAPGDAGGLRCAHCGEILGPGVTFCGSCGQAVAAAEADQSDEGATCPHCGAHNEEGAQFCGECGRSFVEIPVVSSVPTTALAAAPSEAVTPAGQADGRGRQLAIAGGAVAALAVLGIGLFALFGGGDDDADGGDAAVGAAGTASPASTADTDVVVPIPASREDIAVEYILDASGSMLETIDSRTKLAIAEDALLAVLNDLPPGVQVGLRVYGHNVSFVEAERSCQDTELVVPLAEDAVDDIAAVFPSLTAQGMTPMSASLRAAAQDFTDPGRRNAIVLLSDGIETCGDDPAEVVLELQEQGFDITVHVIGLDVDDAARGQLRRIAEVAGGVYHDADSQQSLADALGDVSDDVLATGTDDTVDVDLVPDGLLVVGVDIQPGRYRSLGEFCRWERRSGLGDSEDEVLAVNGIDIFDILPTDAGFFQEDCSPWTEDLSSVTASLTAPFGEGTFLVGVDIASGRWRARDLGDFCSWSRLAGFSGSAEDSIAVGVPDGSTSVVDIRPNDVGFHSSECGIWSQDLSPMTSSTTAPFGDGTYIVGADIAPGTWSAPGTGGCFWERLSGFGEDFEDIIDIDIVEGPVTVTIAPGDAGFSSSGCGQWTLQ